jgi:malate dehydrogenase
MSTVTILGAGELGGALAHRLAGRDRVRRISLVDEAAQVAAGKALDVLQAGPVEGFSTRVTSATLDKVPPSDVVVLADPWSAVPTPFTTDAALALVERVSATSPDAVFVCADANPAEVIEAGVTRLGLARQRLFGSAIGAVAAGLAALLALELDESPRHVRVPVLGSPPDGLHVPWSLAEVDGQRAGARAGHDVLARVAGRLPWLWPPGPHALASSACLVIEAIVGVHRRTVDVLAWLDGEFGQHGRIGAAPARLGRFGISRFVTRTLTDAERASLLR